MIPGSMRYDFTLNDRFQGGSGVVVKVRVVPHVFQNAGA